jgi:hypothetical protein
LPTKASAGGARSLRAAGILDLLFREEQNKNIVGAAASAINCHVESGDGDGCALAGAANAH